MCGRPVFGSASQDMQFRNHKAIRSVWSPWFAALASRYPHPQVISLLLLCSLPFSHHRLVLLPRRKENIYSVPPHKHTAHSHIAFTLASVCGECNSDMLNLFLFLHIRPFYLLCTTHRNISFRDRNSCPSGYFILRIHRWIL